MDNLRKRVKGLEDIKRADDCPAVVILNEWAGETLPEGFRERCPDTVIIIDDIGPPNSEADKEGDK